MPGLSFICDLNNNVNETTVSQALDAMLHFNQYKKGILLEEKEYILGYTKYDEYPLTSFENDMCMISLEGRIYGKEDQALKRELSDLAQLIFQGAETKRSQLANWVVNTDGDFIVVLFNKISREICFLNDGLSRLPLYYFHDKGRILISREIDFIAALSSNFEFDRMAIAQYLLFGYPLGKRTIYRNVFRLSPSTLIRIDLRSFEIEMNELHQYNFEEKKYHKITINENAKQLSSIFSDSCKNRQMANFDNILSLSGGLDSRSVGACLHKNNIPFFAATFQRNACNRNLDVQIAEQLAKIFQAEWHLINLDLPKGKDFVRLLRLKKGLNYLGMSFILPFFEKIKEIFRDRVIYFTGDGGDKLLPDLRPCKRIRNIDDLVKYILLHNQIYSLHDVSHLMDYPINEIVDDLRDTISRYPEQTWDQKYVHFLIYERGFKLNFEGEDRNRYYFWSSAPFYSINFFNYAMNCLDDQKSRYSLYKSFLLEIAPKAAAICNACWELPIIAKRLRVYLLIESMYMRLPVEVKKVIRKYLLKNVAYLSNTEVINCCSEQLRKCKAIYQYLPNVKLINIANSNKTQIETLFTLTSILELIKSGSSTMENHRESTFG